MSYKEFCEKNLKDLKDKVFPIIENVCGDNARYMKQRFHWDKLGRYTFWPLNDIIDDIRRENESIATPFNTKVGDLVSVCDYSDEDQFGIVIKKMKRMIIVKIDGEDRTYRWNKNLGEYHRRYYRCNSYVLTEGKGA